jgi:diaminopimelate epimerase
VDVDGHGSLWPAQARHDATGSYCSANGAPNQSVHSGNSQGTVREQSGNSQGTVREQSGNSQGTVGEQSGNGGQCVKVLSLDGCRSYTQLRTHNIVMKLQIRIVRPKIRIESN